MTGIGARVLYLSYDGLCDPLGQSQILPYLSGATDCGHNITIVSFEKAQAFAKRGEVVADACRAAGIRWTPLKYRKHPPIFSTLRDLGDLRRAAFRLHDERKFDLVHCRSYLPGLIGLAMKRKFEMPFLFDMRGFWIDERFERGIWPVGHPLYATVRQYLRKREAEMFCEADAVVSLTHAAIDRIARDFGEKVRDKSSVIPCCVDLELFNSRGGEARREGRAMLGLADDVPLLLYIGSLGGAYPLDPLFRFFNKWSRDRSNAKLLFVTRHGRKELLEHPGARAIADKIIVHPAERQEVPILIAAADVGTSFVLPSPAAIASSPTKVGEMLAMGVPVVANDGVGDTGRIFADKRGGIAVPDLKDNSLDKAASAFDPKSFDPAAVRSVSEEHYSLREAIRHYDLSYRALMAAFPVRSQNDG